MKGIVFGDTKEDIVTKNNIRWIGIGFYLSYFLAV